MNPPVIPITMRAAVLYGKEDVRVESLPVTAPGPGEVLLKIEAALTCGTDLKVFRRGYHAAMIVPPSVFGHECAGVIAACGAGVEARFAPGTRVVVANSAPCGACAFCVRGQENLCVDLHFINGGYAQYLKIPKRFVEKNLHALPAGLSFEAAALTEPLACVAHGVETLAPKYRERIAVVGLGPIGLFFVALLKTLGCHVIGVGRHAVRLDAAQKLGAAEVLEADPDGKWLEKLRGDAPDSVVEATGLPEVWEQAVRVVRRGGQVLLFGGCPAGTTVTLDTHRIHYDQITLRSPFHHRPRDVKVALAALAAGEVPAAPFISGERPLADLPALFREMLAAKSQVKICIRP